GRRRHRLISGGPGPRATANRAGRRKLARSGVVGPAPGGRGPRTRAGVQRVCPPTRREDPRSRPVADAPASTPDSTKELDLAKSRSTFGKRDREMAKAAKASAK